VKAVVRGRPQRRQVPKTPDCHGPGQLTTGHERSSCQDLPLVFVAYSLMSGDAKTKSSPLWSDTAQAASGPSSGPSRF
jgi:hypothetical protein